MTSYCTYDVMLHWFPDPMNTDGRELQWDSLILPIPWISSLSLPRPSRSGSMPVSNLRRLVLASIQYCIIWKVSPLPKVSPPSKVSPPLQCISNGRVRRRDPLFESKPPGLLSRLYSTPIVPLKLSLQLILDC